MQRPQAISTRSFRLLAAGLAALLLMALLGGQALAHPLGNFTINRYARLTFLPDQAQLYAVVDMAEIPAFQARQEMDADGDGVVNAQEAAAGLDALARQLTPQLQLRVNGETAPWTRQDLRFEFPEGQGGLPTLWLELWLAAPLPEGDAWRIVFENQTFAGRIGWQEVILQAGDGIELLESTAPQEDVSNGLRAYPSDMLQSPPTVSAVSAGLRQVGSSAIPPDSASASPRAADTQPSSQEPFAALIALPLEGPVALFWALLAAFLWGGAHALSPGHGKTIVAAYLVGSRGTARHALFLGLTTTITHTAGVFVLGLVTLFASRYILPETLYPWLSLISGLLVVLVGFSLMRGRLAGLIPGLERGTHHHPHAHDHHHHDHEHGHSHLPPGAEGEAVTWRSLLGLGVSGGLAPCPSALVVMLGAIALGRIPIGLLLILVFSLGLAGVLTVIGVLTVHAGKLLTASPWARLAPGDGRLMQWAPVVSAVFIMLVGAGIAVRAILATGLV